MPAEVIMPALGMAQESGKVLRWLKAEGDRVAKDEPLVEIETDKVTVEIESPADGTLGGVRAAEGEEIPVGQAIAVVLAPGEQAVEERAAHEAGRAGPRRRPASPKARRLAAARGVSIDDLVGSGPRGVVVARDVDAAGAASGATDGSPLPKEAPALGTAWRVMAERTVQSWQSAPHIWLRREVEAARLQSWRAAMLERPGCEEVTYTDLLVKVAAEALERHPRVNSSWQEGRIVRGAGINVAIAVATDDGLFAPVVHGADGLDLAAIAARRVAVVAAARDGRLRPEDVTGGTFTVSNLGMFGVDSFDAILNPPQAAILAVGRIRARSTPVDGRPAVQPMLQLSVAFDHRVVDGARGAEFVETLASLIEEPAGLVR